MRTETQNDSRREHHPYPFWHHLLPEVRVTRRGLASPAVYTLGSGHRNFSGRPNWPWNPVRVARLVPAS